MSDLRIIEVFDSIQGEGYWSGVPMTFIRLAGCNASRLGLACVSWCDTPLSWDAAGGQGFSAAELASRVRFPRVCVTGGEPLLQADKLASLVRELHRCGKQVHLETNGTIHPGPLFAPGDPETEPDWVVVSPKPPCFELDAGWRGRVDELKLVADDCLGGARAEQLASLHPDAIVSVQPEWGGGEEARERAIVLVMSHPAWRLSLQVHKLLGLP
jgi:7-carboxy-7-deazaguanine synthase